MLKTREIVRYARKFGTAGVNNDIITVSKSKFYFWKRYTRN